MKSKYNYRPARTIAAMLLLLTAAVSCKKDKLDNVIPKLNVDNKAASAIRLFNFALDADITVNNIPLTNYVTTNPGQVPSGTQLGLSIFPTGVWSTSEIGSPFNIPASLLDKDGKAFIQIKPRQFTYNGPFNGEIDTTIVNDVTHPQDYYLMGNGTIKIINRDALPPSSPQNFKIRVINLGADQDAYIKGLKGPVSLTYADGSAVSPKLNNIAQGANSDYVELPYGSYQFKLFIANGGSIDVTKQLAEYPVYPYFDPCNPTVAPQQNISPRVRTFKPGGIYTLVVTLNSQDLFQSCDRQTRGVSANSYRLLTELDPGVNSTFARMQAVNAIPGKQVTFTVDGQTLGAAQPYVGSINTAAAYAPDYQVYVQGKRHVQAKDQTGALLAEGDVTLYPYDNYTIWAYNKPDGKPALIFAANDMTGSIYRSSYHPDGSGGAVIPDDGINGQARRGQFNYALECRFFNLCPDLPYATFSNDHQLFLPAYNVQAQTDTMRYFGSYVNLMPGQQPASNPSIIYSLYPYSVGQANTPVATPFDRPIVPKIMRVYSSTPGLGGQVPGTLLTDVTPINTLEKFIANPSLYTYPQFRIPENGVYSVALVGKLGGSTSGGDKARLIVIKHNK